MESGKDAEIPGKQAHFIIVAAGLYLFSVGYAIAVQRPFFADGAHYFLKLLEEKSFIYGDDFARHFAHYATQFIMVILIRIFHVTDLDVLSAAFGFGLYFPQIISLAICYFIAKKRDINVMVFPVIGLFGITLNVSFMMVHEVHVIANFFWPILFYVVLVKEYRWYDVAILLALAVIFTRCYEAAAIWGSLLILLTGAVLIEQWRVSSAGTKTVRILLLAVLCVSVVIAVLSILNPRCPENKAAFLSSFANVMRHWPALLSLAYILVLSLCMVWPSFAGSSLLRIIAVLLIVFTLFVSFIPALMPDLTRPSLHYDARVYMTYILPLFALVAYAVVKGIVRVPASAWKQIVPLVLLLVIGQTTWQLLATSQWAGFREVFGKELNARQGFVRFEDTALTREREGLQLIKPMTWPWTNPTLSILWSQNRDVKAVISSSAVSWEPFDPLKAEALPRVEEFGFTFDKYKSSLGRTAK
jgi:hypothetical protein